MKYNKEIRKNLCNATVAAYIERRIDSLENCLAFATYEIYENALLSASSKLLIMAANVVARRNNLSDLCGKFEEVLNYKSNEKD
jgi:hypothetical protein